MERWPEPIRWLLFLPLLIGGCLLASLIARSANDGWWLEIAVNGFGSYVLFALVAALAPRGRIPLLWIFYVLLMTVAALWLVVWVYRGVNGTWTSFANTTNEFMQGVAMIVPGTISFRKHLDKCREERRSAPPPPPPRSVTQKREDRAVVDECLGAFHAIQTELSSQNPGALLGLPADTLDAVRRLVEDEQATVHTVLVEKVRPRDLVWIVISNVTGEALETGQFHIYRNVLSLSGKALFVLFMRAVDELERSGHYAGREKTAASERAWIRKCIAEVG